MAEETIEQKLEKRGVHVYEGHALRESGNRVTIVSLREGEVGRIVGRARIERGAEDAEAAAVAKAIGIVDGRAQRAADKAEREAARVDKNKAKIADLLKQATAKKKTPATPAPAPKEGE